MKKAWIIAGSVVGVGAVAAGGTVLALVLKGAKIDPINQPVLDIEAGAVSLLNVAPGNATETLTKDNFETEIDSIKGKLTDWADRIQHPDVGSVKLNIKYHDATVELYMKINRVAGGKFKIEEMSTYLIPVTGPSILQDQIKGPNNAAFKLNARKFIYALLMLDKSITVANDALTAVTNEMTHPTKWEA